MLTVKELQAIGGITLNNDALDEAKHLYTGFMVSIKAYEIIKKVEEVNDDMLYVLASSLSSEAIGFSYLGLDSYIGLWIDDDYVYIDISINIKSYDLAVAFARLNNQLAIYDVYENTTIYI